MAPPARAAATALPLTQNTAPVHEFSCLYTHDVRRKQKRWQDGFIRLYTFNQRVMELEEGDEVTLENGVMVEVVEATATTHTDLDPVLQKRAGPTMGAFGGRAQPPNRPLSEVLGIPKGPMGRARLPGPSGNLANGQQTNAPGGGQGAAQQTAAPRDVVDLTSDAEEDNSPEGNESKSQCSANIDTNN
ncbi:uncharacterized protein J3D65DRAFT_671929 [Phyllosticta citribraziliensis]|uniref:5'-3' DNA helicase ZGRF1-like N-terminal domain-containing protein n=1 Tax=Phyllosticta citribraziliensis TaxID=989973 RepID=A0ABR1L4H3_9PEZI